jgi:hypothetical protein
MTKKIIILDDSAHQLDLDEARLISLGYSVLTAENQDELRSLLDIPFNLVLASRPFWEKIPQELKDVILWQDPVIFLVPGGDHFDYYSVADVGIEDIIDFYESARQPIQTYE